MNQSINVFLKLVLKITNSTIIKTYSAITIFLLRVITYTMNHFNSRRKEMSTFNDDTKLLIILLINLFKIQKQLMMMDKFMYFK